MRPSRLPLIRLFDRVSAGQAPAAGGQGGVPGRVCGDLDGLRGGRLRRRPGDPPAGGRLAVAGRPALGAGRGGAGPGRRVPVPTRKDRCLTVCRHPGGYLRQHYRRGLGAALRLGAGHGVFCVGCCWALMLVAFAAGVASLWWMATLTAVMGFEKTGPAGRRGVRPIGIGLIVLGLLMLATGAAERSSTLRPWGKGPATAQAATQAATPKGATRLVVVGQEVDFTIIDAAPTGDSPGDQILFTDDLLDQSGRRVGRDEARCTIMFRGDVLCDATFVIDGKGQLTIEGVGLTFAVTGGTGRFRQARGQLHETFLPTGQFRFAFTLYL
ncbi:MAG TPA: DUF2182 domain-containing protein, partial [Actinomycetes bacterium]|nr:DUF2182 domain-containing protein [Actinomycetes bacterium]